VISQQYRVSRIILARLSAEEYIRSFWWFILIIPTFGLACLIFGSGLLQIIGWMAVLWPFSIPARSVISSSKAGKLLSRGTRVELKNGTLYFSSDDGKGLKLELWAARDVVVRGEYALVRMRRFGFVPIPVSALPTDGVDQLTQAILAERKIRIAKNNAR
jgi:hypothetical protein